jgi:hypothetical protein
VDPICHNLKSSNWTQIKVGVMTLGPENKGTPASFNQKLKTPYYYATTNIDKD